MTQERHIAVLSRLLFQGYGPGWAAPKHNLEAIYPDLEYVSGLNDEGLQELSATADTHHVLMRAFQVLERAASIRGDARIEERCQRELAREASRVVHAVDSLAPICAALEQAGCPVTVIKSLDHWPDLGSDLDLYTSGHPDTVLRVMEDKFAATTAARSWGDRLANKWNFSVPGLPELIEIHVQHLGQTGEHTAIAKRVIERRVVREIAGNLFRVPAPEERIVISTLQRMYRHFYFRLCDMADVWALLQQQALDFAELHKAADAGGIWPGAATFLHLIAKYVRRYRAMVDLPESVVAAAHAPKMEVHLQGDFLRVPLLPSA